MTNRHRVLAGFSGNTMDLWRVPSLDQVVGQKVLVGDEDARSMLGGTTFNLADGFGQLSSRVDCRSLITVGVQPDAGSDSLAKETLNRGFDCRFLRCRSETSRATIIMEDSGRTTIIGRKPGYVTVPCEEISEEVDRYAPDTVIASGVVPDDVPLVEELFKAAGNVPLKVFNPRRELAMTNPEAFRELASMSNMLVVNDVEAAAILEVEEWHYDPTRIDQIKLELASMRELGPKTVIVTCNSHGAVYASNDEFVYHPAVDVGPVHETTGAGDSFLVAFLVARFEGLTVDDAMRFASVVAGIKVSRSEPGMPSREDVNQILARM